jgi:hypothetical protein
MEYTFVKFEHTNQKNTDKITVTPRNAFGFPTKFFKDENIASYNYAVLFYDVNNKAVGIHFTNSTEEKHKFSIIKSKQGYGGSIVATSFFMTYNIDSKLYRGKYNWEKKNQTGIGVIYIIVLKEKEEKEKVQPQQTVIISDGGVPERS